MLVSFSRAVFSASHAVLVLLITVSSVRKLTVGMLMFSGHITLRAAVTTTTTAAATAG